MQKWKWLKFAKLSDYRDLKVSHDCHFGCPDAQILGKRRSNSSISMLYFLLRNSALAYLHVFVCSNAKKQLETHFSNVFLSGMRY